MTETIKKIDDDTLEFVGHGVRYHRPFREKHGAQFTGGQEIETLENGRWEGIVSVCSSQDAIRKREEHFYKMMKMAEKNI